MRASAKASCAAQPPNSWPRVSGVASMRCVRPILTTSRKTSPRDSRLARSLATEGSSFAVISCAAATCIAVGITSFDDCDRFTWSFGWIGSLLPSTPPARAMARFAMTSLAFMLVCVPLPVCQTTSGKWSSSAPRITSSAARSMSSQRRASSTPRARFVRAAAFFTTPSACTKLGAKRSPPMRKFSSKRCVCAPQYRSAGTAMRPMESLSQRVPVASVVIVTASAPRTLRASARRGTLAAS